MTNYRNKPTGQKYKLFGAEQPSTFTKTKYSTISYYIPLKDGIQLAADVLLPEPLSPGTKLPSLLSLQRYWRDFELRIPLKWFMQARDLNPYFKNFFPYLLSSGYALVNVDVRGTGASFGRWPYPWDQKSVRDAYEVVDWIVSQPWSNGKIGGYGISYVGTTAELLQAANHPAIQAVIPMFNHPYPFTDIAFPGGVLNAHFMNDWGHLDLILDHNQIPDDFGLLGKIFIKGVKPVKNGDSEKLKQAIQDHQNNGSVFDLVLNVNFIDEKSPSEKVTVEEISVHNYMQDIQQSNAAIFGWGSWMDAGTADAVLRRFVTFKRNHIAVIGAWEHGGRFNASPYQSQQIDSDPPMLKQWGEMVTFFDTHLKETSTLKENASKVLHYYTLGEEKWKYTTTFPIPGTKYQRLYFQENNFLSTQQPDSKTGFDSYQVDFEATTGPQNRWWEMGGIQNKTVIYPNRAEEDKRLLTYTSHPLEQDIEITGYPIVTLYATSTEPDCVFYVYLEDVHENGTVNYITEGILRSIHRKVLPSEESPYKILVPYHSYRQEDVMYMVPGEVTELTFGLYPTSVLIHKGHRIRIAIAGHDKDTFKRIPANGAPVYEINRNTTYASFIDLPIIPR
jgi:putative CocE/NonD family hydrolase